MGALVGGTFKHTMASNETERMIIKSAARKEDRVCMNAACWMLAIAIYTLHCCTFSLVLITFAYMADAGTLRHRLQV